MKDNNLCRKCPICNDDVFYSNVPNLLAAKRDNSPCKKCCRKSEKKYIRVCPKCNKEIKHSSKRGCDLAIKKGTLCSSCGISKDMPLIRNCPQCNNEIHYTNKHNCRSAEINKRICKNCVIKNRDFNGENNPFYGKTHSDETKEKISKFNSEERVLSDEFLEKARINLSKVTNKTPLYDIWLSKYNKEIADNKLISFKKKQSENNSGEKNSMYGKPSPQGSGNGWSGWYKNWFFRSLRELSYMINVIEKENHTWRTPDKTFKIKYKDQLGNIRNYFPDFILDNNVIIEIKPERLQNTAKVLAKQEAAIEFCKNNNMEYKITDVEILSQEEIIKLYNNNEIKFLDRYDKKFKERYLK